MEPSPDAFKRKNGGGGSDNGRYGNRFQKWLIAQEALTTGLQMPHPHGKVQLILPTETACGGILKRVLGTKEGTAVRRPGGNVIAQWQ